MSDDFGASMELRRQGKEKIKKEEYDVFISYNHDDRHEVKEICDLLIDNGIAPYFDERSLPPGRPFPPEIEQQIQSSKAVAVFLKAGWGPYHKREAELALEQQKQRGIPVIPVLLPGANKDLLSSLPLKTNTWLQFRKGDVFGRRDPDPLERLIFGITKKHVRPLRPFALIASLGESPAVVPEMYDLLREREGLSIGRVHVLYPEDDKQWGTVRSYELVEEALPELTGDRLRSCSLPFKDADSLNNACKFLQKLFQLLQDRQEASERVCLSLAGGRKSMAALMAWVAPFFPCVKKLCHVVDPERDEFPSLAQLRDALNNITGAEQRKLILRPDSELLAPLKLVDIPFGRGQHLGDELRSKLFSGSPRQLTQYGAAFVHALAQKDGPIPAPPEAPEEGRESVLIVPLGKLPMVATQLYTLLAKREDRTIRAVYLVYPQFATEIVTAAEIVQEALQEEAGIQCTLVPVPDLEDIDSSEACTSYQQALENTILQARNEHPGCAIDLALSGGRKGMTAMTIFAAQKHGIKCAYHTLISDEEVSQRIDKETTVTALKEVGLSHQERNDRLFLRAYEHDDGPSPFALFPIPIFPAGDC